MLYDELLFEAGRGKGIELICNGKYPVPQGKDNLVYRACMMLYEAAGHGDEAGSEAAEPSIGHKTATVGRRDEDHPVDEGQGMVEEGTLEDLPGLRFELELIDRRWESGRTTSEGTSSDVPDVPLRRRQLH